MKLLMEALNGATFKLAENGGLVARQKKTLNPITIHEQDGRIWLEVTVYDGMLEDGIEIEYEIKRVN